VLAVPGTAGTVVAQEGSLSARRQRLGMVARLASLVGDKTAEYVQIGTFSLCPMPSSPPATPPGARRAAGPAHNSVAATATPRVRSARMGLFDLLPGFSKGEVPEGYARASHVLFLGNDAETEEKADAVLERIRAGSLTFAQAARQYSNCPTRDQEPPGDLGTFASLSFMSKVDEMRSFDGVMELPYEGQNTREFDDAVFSAPLNEPVKAASQWGYHLLLVTERGGGDRAVIAPEKGATIGEGSNIQAPKSDAGRSL